MAKIMISSRRKATTLVALPAFGPTGGYGVQVQGKRCVAKNTKKAKKAKKGLKVPITAGPAVDIATLSDSMKKTYFHNRGSTVGRQFKKKFLGVDLTASQRQTEMHILILAYNVKNNKFEA